MQKSMLLFLFILFVVACAPKVSFPNSCPNDCAELDIWTAKLGMDASQYETICSSCSSGRGASFRARFVSQEGPVDVSYHNGWCSSGGADCGFDVRVATKGNSMLYEAVKNRYCGNCSAFEREQDGVRVFALGQRSPLPSRDGTPYDPRPITFSGCFNCSPWENLTDLTIQ